MRIGLEGFLYYLSTGTRASWGTTTLGITTGAAPANLAVVGGIQDLGVDMEKNEVDGSSRDAQGWEQIASALRKAPLTFKQIYNPADAGQLAIIQNFMSNTSIIAMAILDADKATSGVMGFWADFEILSMKKAEPLQGAQTWDVTAKPSFRSLVPPQWVKVA